MFGVSASGKTCFLYAMARVLRNGVRHGDNLVQIISNRHIQQIKLDEGYMQLVCREWPQSSNETEEFDFKVKMQCNGNFDEIIDSLIIQDYRGGILQDTSENAENNLNKLLVSFRGSSAIIFIIDGQTIVDAMSAEDRDVCHRKSTDSLEQFKARTQIQYVESLFMEYKRIEKDGIPPILIAISKGDVFASEYEKSNGIRLIKENLPSIFATGSKLIAGITVMSLGENLGRDVNGKLHGTLKLNEDLNIHVPVIFGVYADLCYLYEETTEVAKRNGILVVLNQLRKMFANRIQLYKNGKLAREV